MVAVLHILQRIYSILGGILRGALQEALSALSPKQYSWGTTILTAVTDKRPLKPYLCERVLVWRDTSKLEYPACPAGAVFTAGGLTRLSQMHLTQRSSPILGIISQHNATFISTILSCYVRLTLSTTYWLLDSFPFFHQLAAISMIVCSCWQRK